MFTGTTIDELVGMVERAEAHTRPAKKERDMKVFTAPALNVYGIEQFKQFERDFALMGVA